MSHPARGDADAHRCYFADMDASMDLKAGFLSAHLLTDPRARIPGCGRGRHRIEARDDRVVQDDGS